mgnify:FL=1
MELLALRLALENVNRLVSVSNAGVSILSGVVSGIGTAFSTAFGLAVLVAKETYSKINGFYNEYIEPILEKLGGLAGRISNWASILVNPLQAFRNYFVTDIVPLLDRLDNFSFSNLMPNVPDFISSPVNTITAASGAYQTASNNTNFTFTITQNLSGITDKFDKRKLASDIANEMSKAFQRNLGYIPGLGRR